MCGGRGGATVTSPRVADIVPMIDLSFILKPTRIVYRPQSCSLHRVPLFRRGPWINFDLEVLSFNLRYGLPLGSSLTPCVLGFHEKACWCQVRVWNSAMIFSLSAPLRAPVVLLSEALGKLLSEATAQPRPHSPGFHPHSRLSSSLGPGAHWGPTHVRCCYLQVGLRRDFLLRS